MIDKHTIFVSRDEYVKVTILLPIYIVNIFLCKVKKSK